MYVLVGLGNPGPQYALNRHNIGFMAIDCVCDFYRFSPFQFKYKAHISEGTIGPHKVILCKPQTFMNLSGQSIGDLIRYLKIPLHHVYVYHDDLDLEPGRIKVKKGGGNGGHNGLKSLDAHIGADYWRLRLGIGHPGHRDIVSPYVLSNFTKNDQNWLLPFLQAVSQHLEHLIGQNDPAFWLNKVNLDLKNVT